MIIEFMACFSFGSCLVTIFLIRKLKKKVDYLQGRVSNSFEEIYELYKKIDVKFFDLENYSLYVKNKRETSCAKEKYE